jgi:starch synthase
MPNNAEQGFHGGEGLESELQSAAEQGRLIGIINGIYYSNSTEKSLSWPVFMQQMSSSLLNAIARSGDLAAADYVAHQRLLHWQQKQRPTHLITSVGRLTSQKIALLLEPFDDGQLPLEQLLATLSGRGLFILLGSGDAQLERDCQRVAAENPHFIFINQYSEPLSSLLFSHGDLFLMPSSFEPCGISQMLAMRQGQPCLAHAVGGLVDTIHDDFDGFLFSGDSMQSKSNALIRRFEDALSLREKRPTKFSALTDLARKRKFDWQESAKRYLLELYS